jgi:hypothetical protein
MSECSGSYAGRRLSEIPGSPGLAVFALALVIGANTAILAF